MKLYLGLALLIVGCGDASSDESHRTNGFVVPANGDAANYTWTGYPRHRYAACGRYVELPEPFEVISDNLNDDPIAIPISYLDNPRTKDRPPEDYSAQRRITFAFPIGEEWQSRTGGLDEARPLSQAVAFLSSAQARQTNGIDGESNYNGIVNGHHVALHCTATHWPNPFCEAAVTLNAGSQRFLAILPPTSVARLERVIDIGIELFSDTAKSCVPGSPLRTPELTVIRLAAKKAG